MLIKTYQVDNTLTGCDLIGRKNHTLPQTPGFGSTLQVFLSGKWDSNPRALSTELY